jgi:hypothetical protein
VKTIRILLQTTIPFAEDNWNVGRFSRLVGALRETGGAAPGTTVDVVARDRASVDDDPVLLGIDESDFDEVWLMGVDGGQGLTAAEAQALIRFRERGGGLLTARDHQDLGSCLCAIPGPGTAHFFHSRNLDPDVDRRCDDDRYTKGVTWPNFHSGRNGDVQRVTPTDPVHPLLLRNRPGASALEFFPAHPHEGDIGVPSGEAPEARVIASSKSSVTGRRFNLIVAFEQRQTPDGKTLGRAVAESSFHHFADYNWDVKSGAPSFVDDPEGTAIQENPALLEDIKTYVHNAARWLAP